MNGEIKDKLQRLIIEKALKFGDFVLASGKRSKYYINCKNITLHREGLFLVCSIFLQWLRSNYPDVNTVGGPTLGADPITGGMVALGIENGIPLNGFIIRKKPKEHGTSQWIEGMENITPGCKVILLEDVVTTGMTSLRSIQVLQDEGLKVMAVFSIVDREEGAEEAFEKKGIRLFSIFKITELLDSARQP